MEIFRMPNYITEEDILLIINYIEEQILKNQGNIKESRTILKFGGKDDSEQLMDRLDIDMLGDIKNLVIGYWKKAANTIQELSKSEKTVYPSTVWLSKQLSGNFIEIHADNAAYGIDRYSYSGLIYFNKQHRGGQLYFPEKNLSISPETGEFVFFNSSEPHGVSTVRQNRYAMVMWFTTDPEYKFEE
jgi:Rps23 Pro-64 3,4-dihydroxylase Tpa1-like proline 4-hydroxylase